jgi:hypothetical protein
MSEFLTTKGIAASIESIIIGAESNLVLISPYLQISTKYISRLSEASARGVHTCIVYRKEKLSPEETSSLNVIKNLEIRLEENLHAKCYLNENKLLIATMNFYEYSEKNNIEMGILLDYKNDESTFRIAKQEADCIIHSSKPGLLIGSNISFLEHGSKKVIEIPKNYKVERNEGHCIRCNIIIPYDPKRPFCKECFYIWDQYGDPDYEEDFCHSCGQLDDTSKNHPECYSCYSAHRHSNKLMGRTG